MMLVTDVHVAAATLFGVWAAGAVPIQIGVPYRLTDAASFLEQLRVSAARLDARALLISPAFAAFAGQSRSACPVLIADTLLEPGPAAALPDPEAAPGPALIQLTSGSTGHPRGVVIPHERLMGHLEAMSEALPMRGDEAGGVSWLPLHHDMGLIGGLLFPLFNAFPVHMLSPLSFRARPFAWLEEMARIRGTISLGPPSAYAILLQLARRAAEVRLDLSPWRCAMVGAEPISAALLRRFAQAYAPCGFRAEAFFPVYGLAEATVAVTFPTLLGATRVERVERLALEREGRAVPAQPGPDAVELVGVGRAIPGTEVRIVDDAGHLLNDRAVGAIEVRSSTGMVGYYEEPVATAEAFDGQWLRTGDLGFLVDGVLFVTGRSKELIIKGGHNLVPAVLEEIAGGVEGVRAGCVAAVGVISHERQTELVYVVAETRVPPAEHGGLAASVREALKVHGIAVDHVVLLPPGELPKTTSGKLRRREVAEWMRARTKEE
jgi:fatty-acyl-CoA synthase